MPVPVSIEEDAHVRRLRHYYGHPESRFIYDGLLGSRHFGWYEPGQPAWDVRAAQRRMVGVVAARLALPPGSAVLDAGCGGGDVARTLAARHGLDVTGIDLCDFHVDMAWKRAARAGLSQRTRFQVADYHRLPFPDASFDGVVALETLLHSYDLHRALSEFLRVLRPGGRLVVCDFSMAPDLPAELEEECGAVWENLAVPEFRGLRLGALEEAVIAAGFTVESSVDASANIRPMVRLGYLFARLPYLLANAAGAGSLLVNCKTAVETFQKMDLGYGIHTAIRP